MNVSSNGEWNIISETSTMSAEKQENVIIERKKSSRKHILSDKNLVEKTAICKHCGKVDIKIFSNKSPRCMNAFREEKRKYGRKYSRSPAGRLKDRKRKSPYRLVVSPTCVRCGFVAEDLCQIDIHHKDGNHKNNSSENLENICSNCHRLVHKHRCFQS